MFAPIDYNNFGFIEAMRFLLFGWHIESNHPSVVVISLLFNLVFWGMCFCALATVVGLIKDRR